MTVMDNLQLFDLEPLVPVERQLSIAESFDMFHSANPSVYVALVTMARDLHRRGRRQVGIGMLFEVLRWRWSMTTDDPTSEYKLNNNYRSRYARLIMQNEPDLDGIFETRKLTAR